MADAPDTEEIVLDPDLEADEPEQEAPEAADPPESEDDAEEETLISFGDAEDLSEEQDGDNNTVRQMRAAIRERDRRIRELETTNAPKVPEARPKPTLESCEYDEEKFAAELLEWNNEQKAEDERKEAEKAEARRVQEEWEADLGAFQEKKKALSLPDIDECQEVVESAFNLVQQAVMVKAANDSALFMVALAKSPTKMAELAKIQDPIKLAAAIARMEGGIKVIKKRKGPAIDTPQRGSAAIPAGSTDKQLEKLEKEAERTGDRTALRKYRKEHGLKP